MPRCRLWCIATLLALVFSTAGGRKCGVAQLSADGFDLSVCTKLTLGNEEALTPALLATLCTRLTEAGAAGVELSAPSNPQLADGKAIAAFLAACPSSLHSLNLYDCAVSSAGSAVLSSALNGTTVSTLGLGGNRLDDEAASYLADALATSSVAVLGLYGNDIGDDGARHLAAALPKAKLLHALYLGNNRRLGDAGIAALAAALASAPHLRTLTLEGGRVGDLAACALARALLHHRNPQQPFTLDVRTCLPTRRSCTLDAPSFGAAGAKCLHEAKQVLRGGLTAQTDHGALLAERAGPGGWSVGVMGKGGPSS